MKVGSKGGRYIHRVSRQGGVFVKRRKGKTIWGSGYVEGCNRQGKDRS